MYVDWPVGSPMTFLTCSGVIPTETLASLLLAGGATPLGGFADAVLAAFGESPLLLPPPEAQATSPISNENAMRDAILREESCIETPRFWWAEV